MKNQVDLKKLIKELTEAQLEYDRLAFDEEEEHDLGLPASTQQITYLENILGKPLPPSYRSFLELHNGWSDFDGGAKLLSVEDHENAWVKERLKEIGELFFEIDSKNPFLNGCIPILIGKDENNYLVLDPISVRENGEMDFVMYDFGIEERRYKDFTLFLQHDLELMQKIIEEERHGTIDEDDGEQG